MARNNSEPIKIEKESHVSIVNSQNLFYEETYYLANVRENYLVLVSDSMHVIEIPVGLIKEKIVIGDPIKLKLELDVKRAEKKKKKFMALQEHLLNEFSEN